MEYVKLIGKRDDLMSLESFAQRFFDTIGVSDFKVRESSNYIDGHYFKGSNDAMTFEISNADLQGHDDLPYSVFIGGDARDIESLRLSVDDLVRKKLLPEGFQFAKLILVDKRYKRFDYPSLSPI